MTFLLDSNILIYAYCEDMPQHTKVGAWLTRTVNSSDSIILTETVVLSFYRIASNDRAMSNPLSVADIAAAVENLLNQANVILFTPTNAHFRHFEQFCRKHAVSSRLVMDAHLCVAALASGATVATCDKDFKKFPHVKIFNPSS
jgi:toxin-antitoxin system PIN domain toxin